MDSHTFAALSALLQAFAERSAHRMLEELPRWFLGHANRFYWGYLLSFALLGVFAWYRYYLRDGGRRLRDLPGFLFPPAVYRHPSAIVDYQLILMNRLLGPSSVLSAVVLGSLSTAAVAHATQSLLGEWFATLYQPRPWTFATSAAFAIGVTVVADFCTFVTHAISHHVPVLWEFHKVHHTAEVLTPLTVFRKHPVYNVLGKAVQIALLGPVQGLFAFLFVGRAEPVTLFGANIVFMLFHLAGANLRHSHIWLSFGPRLSHVFISPAQHQIHHSKAERHWNRNFGEVFALWDWLFGTLYVPGREREPIEFGVPGAEGREHTSLWRCYWVPFANSARILRRQLGLAPLADVAPAPLDAGRE